MLHQKLKKIILTLGIFAIAALTYAADKVELFVTPNPVQVGVPARLTIRSNDGAQNNFSSSLPEIEGLRWMNGTSSSRRVSIVNGRRSSIFELSIPFMVEKAGKYTIPSMRLTHNRERTQPLEFQAVELKLTNPQVPRSVQSGVACSSAFTAPDRSADSGSNRKAAGETSEQ